MRAIDFIPGVARWRRGQPWLAVLDVVAVAGLALWWWPAAVAAQLLLIGAQKLDTVAR